MRKTGLEVFSTGDYVRSLVQEEDVESEVKSYKNSDLSMKYNEDVIREVRRQIIDGTRVIDGFPRSLEQIKSISKICNDRVVFAWISLNPLYIYQRSLVRAREQGRPEDDPEVVSGRIRASLDFKKILEDQCIVHGWSMYEFGGDGELESAVEYMRSKAIA